jgi:hypothetical protein
MQCKKDINKGELRQFNENVPWIFINAKGDCKQ